MLERIESIGSRLSPAIINPVTAVKVAAVSGVSGVAGAVAVSAVSRNDRNAGLDQSLYLRAPVALLKSVLSADIHGAFGVLMELDSQLCRIQLQGDDQILAEGDKITALQQTSCRIVAMIMRRQSELIASKDNYEDSNLLGMKSDSNGISTAEAIGFLAQSARLAPHSI